MTKMMVLWPTHNTAPIVDIARIFVDAVIQVHGLPKVIMSDKDT